MARCGKIARLPRTIRDELNRRLDNGEQGKGLLEWLNGLPEVKSVLDMEFEGHLISHCNLTEWRKGGFREWRERQETLALTREFMHEGSEFDGLAAKVVPAVEMVTMAHYAAALQRSTREPDEDPRKQLRRLSKSIRDVVRMRRSEHNREQLKLEREWLELKLRKSPKSPAAETAAANNEVQPMTEEEMAELLKKFLRPNGQRR